MILPPDFGMTRLVTKKTEGSEKQNQMLNAFHGIALGSE